MKIKDTPLILLIEDSPMIQMVTKALLNDAGFAVAVVGSGAEAIAAFTPDKYALIYMDIGLPDQDGYAVTRAIRQYEQSVGAAITPIIALTGDDALDIQDRCSKVGMQGVLSKPINSQQIIDFFQRYAKDKRLPVADLTVTDTIFIANEDAGVIDKDATLTVLGSSKKAQEMLDLFAKELTASFLPALEIAIQADNRDVLYRQTHLMLGNLCYVKLPLLYQAVLQFQADIKNHAQPIDRIYKQVKQQAQRFLATYQRSQ